MPILQGKVAIVTGSGGGIGRAVAMAYARAVQRRDGCVDMCAQLREGERHASRRSDSGSRGVADG